MRTLTITEVVAESGVPHATVHYYLRQGLLPRPKRVAANRFLYDERHVRGLMLIRTLRERRGLSLAMIRRILPELLHLEASEAFVPEMWDRALAPRMASRRRAPSARLLGAAKDAFSRRGFDEVNVDDLCRAARIAKGSFYRHYRSKEELFLTVAELAAEEASSEYRAALAGALPDPASDPGAAAIEAGAAAALAPAIEHRLPIFLELASRSFRRKPGHAAALRIVLSQLATEVGRPLPGDGSAAERGWRVIGGAVTLVLRALLERPARQPRGFDTSSSARAESHTTTATG
ncbi:MAG TPA: MerR family transcriptional regulator [Actinomycetota bacterium]|jgi:AcrR family transcriptional regulator